MTKQELLLQRLANQGLILRQPAQAKSPGLSLAEIVARLGAIQAQDYPGTVWALGLRVPGSTVAEIEQAIEAASIVRTWPMRGTLHFVAARDLRWMLGLLASKVISGTASRQKSLELDVTQFMSSQETMRRVLAGGRLLSRENLLAAVEADGISVAGGRAYHLLFRAALDQVIAVGPTRDKDQHFALLDDWVPDRLDQGLTGEAALAELAWRYFSSHGPVSVKDFAGWAGLTLGEARSGLAANSQRLESFKLDGIDYWGPIGVGEIKREAPIVHLLPGFDEYVLGYKDRTLFLEPRFASYICPGNNGMFIASVVVDGYIRGTWKKLPRKTRLVIEIQPFTSFSEPELAGIEQAAQGFGAFYDTQVEIKQKELA